MIKKDKYDDHVLKAGNLYRYIDLRYLYTFKLKNNFILEEVECLEYSHYDLFCKSPVGSELEPGCLMYIETIDCTVPALRETKVKIFHKLLCKGQIIYILSDNFENGLKRKALYKIG